MKKAIVIQGGGSYGAFTVGRIVRANQNYDYAIGSSTGALIAPFALLNDFTTLKNCYTTIDNNDIYSKVPFYKNGIPKPIMALVAYLRSKKGITDSKPLRELIQRSYTERHHAAILESEKELFVTVCALNKYGNSAAYIDARKCTHPEMCDYLWASTLVPGLFPPHTVGDNDFVDGGTVENVGLKKAIELGANEVDVYLHETDLEGYKEHGKNWVHNLIRAVSIQRQEVVYNDLYFTEMYERSMNLNAVQINRLYLPYPLEGSHIMNFNTKVMKEWYKKGFDHE